LLFFGNPRSKVAWSRWDLNSRPSDFQSDAMQSIDDFPFSNLFTDMERMKNGAILANMGHSNTEIDVASLRVPEIM